MGYSEIMQLLEDEARLLQIPFVGNFELTYRCNLRCAFCYAADRCEMRRELSTEEWKRIFFEMSRLGLTRATFTGGEIFTRPDICELYCYAYDLGIRITLLTNGVLITEDICKLLSLRKPEGVSISVYGAGDSDYLKVTGDPAGFQKLKRALSLLRQYEIPTSLKTIAIPAMRGSINEIRAFAERQGLKITLTKYISPTSNCESKFCRLSAEEIQQLAKSFDNANDIMGGVTDRDSQCAIAGCNAGKGRFAINPYGEMMGCICYPGIKIPIGDAPCQTALTELRQQLSRHTDVCADCKTCPYSAACGKCGGLNFMETGSTAICSQYRKELAKYKLI